MARSMKVTISLPSDLLAWAEAQRRRQGVSRSELMASVLSAWRRSLDDADRAKRYAAAYKRTPETKAELDWSESAAEEMFAELAGRAAR